MSLCDHCYVTMNICHVEVEVKLFEVTKECRWIAKLMCDMSERIVNEVNVVNVETK